MTICLTSHGPVPRSVHFLFPPCGGWCNGGHIGKMANLNVNSGQNDPDRIAKLFALNLAVAAEVTAEVDLPLSKGRRRMIGRGFAC